MDNKKGKVGMENIQEVEDKTRGMGIKKRGRRKKTDEKMRMEIKDQNKYMIDVAKDSELREMIVNALKLANNKDYGKVIQVKDVLEILLPKLTNKEIEKLQENSLTEKEKIHKAHIEFNKKNNLDLSFNEFLIRRLGIN